MKVPLFLCLFAIMATICQAGDDDDYDKRCKYFDFLRACKVGCKALGHTTGVCDENDKCFCSEEDYNFFTDVTTWIRDLDIKEVISRQINKFQRKIDEWEITDKIKTLVPSKCKISQEFCSSACHAIGRNSGVCNSDFTDCDCSDDLVTPKQYGLCSVDTICNIRCMKNGFARGDCEGDQGWDCRCVSNNDVEVDADISDIEYENFDA